MPDDTTALDIELTRNTGSESFDLKAHNWERSIGNNLVAKGILAVAGDLAGKRVRIGFENYTLDGLIADTQSGTYPTASEYPSIDTSVWELATEKEMALAYAARAWGPTAADKFDTVTIGPRGPIGIMISKLNITEPRDSRGPEQYTYSLELAHADVYVGDD